MSEGQDALLQAQSFWLYKRGQLILVFRSLAGAFIPTRGPLDPEGDPAGLMTPCVWASGMYLSLEWEPRVRIIHKRAHDLVEFIELLEDRNYQVDLEPPSKRTRPFRSL